MDFLYPCGSVSPFAATPLNERFALPDKLRFEPSDGGLACAVVTSKQAQARAYLYGAHVTEYRPAGHDPVLFLSPLSVYGKGKAIRGGVPISPSLSRKFHTVLNDTYGGASDFSCVPLLFTISCPS